MTVIYLPLTLTELTQPDYRLLKEALSLAITEHVEQLIIGIQCEEIKAQSHCLDSIWLKLQTLLGHIYVTQLKHAYKAKDPLFNCNVVFEDLCGYVVHLEPQLTKVCFSEKEGKQIDQWNKERTSAGLNVLDKHILESTEPVIQELHIQQSITSPQVFRRVAVGGTFDHLHAGHKILLTMTALLSENSIVVGVTDDCMLTKKKHQDLIASTADRIEKVKTYLHFAKRNIQYDVVPITDPFGPTVTDPTIDALVVSKETLKGGDLVNSERGIRGYPALELRIIDVISTDNHSIGEEDMAILKISSSWIREYVASQRTK